MQFGIVPECNLNVVQLWQKKGHWLIFSAWKVQRKSSLTGFSLEVSLLNSLNFSGASGAGWKCDICGRLQEDQQNLPTANRDFTVTDELPISE